MIKVNPEHRALFNKVNGKLLKMALANSTERRITLSFYRYVRVDNPVAFRDELYAHWSDLGVLGRVYVASEGINAQISVPENRFADFQTAIREQALLTGVRLNIAVAAEEKSFFKLKIKIRKKLVADGLPEHGVDFSRRGTHLDAKSFNELTNRPETVVVDMRNHYESRIGHFEGAICPDVDTFRDSLPIVVDLLKEYKDKPVVMYCTGGIRCEKASSYMIQNGFTDVYQLDGGIINYAHQVEEMGLENRFRGKNFVFDERLAEPISQEVIATCDQCGKPCDTYINCNHLACNLLFIQCPECAATYEHCCSETCRDIARLPEDEQKEMRKGIDFGNRIFSKGRFARHSEVQPS